MANPTSRSELQEYCLRRLGKGVIDINVSTDQIDDRTDEAIQFFQEYHFDGVEKTYHACSVLFHLWKQMTLLAQLFGCLALML